MNKSDESHKDKAVKVISRKEARRVASRIVASLAYYDAEVAEKFSDLVPEYDEKQDIGRIEDEFYKVIKRLEGT